MATDNRKELGGTFDTAVSLYEKMRPGYVDELYKAIFDYVSIDENSSVVEVGSGSGQATLPILKTGCALTAVEYGENFSTLLKDKFKESFGRHAVEFPVEDSLCYRNRPDVHLNADGYALLAELLHARGAELGYWPREF